MRCLLLLAVAAAATACTDDPPDFGAPSDVFPDHAPEPPAVVNRNLAPVMASVRVVPIFFAGDPLRADIATFLGTLAASPVWRQQVGEYGVGPLTVAPAVTLADAAPAHATSDELVTLLSGLLDGTHAELGPVDPATLAVTLYAVHYPASTVFTQTTDGSLACTSFGGYHDAIPRGTGHAVYAAIFECDHGFQLTRQLDITTYILSHEIAEAATDPLPFQAWSAPSPVAVPWGVTGGGPEIGDMCVRAPPVTPPDLGYAITPTWSNAEAAAFHDPCVPAAPGAFFATVPEQRDTAFPLVSFESFATPATKIAVGRSRTITLDLLSAAATDGDWTIEPFEPFAKREHVLDFTLDRATGQNGNRVHLTVTLLAEPSDGFVVYGLRSTLGGRTTVWYGVVTTP